MKKFLTLIAFVLSFTLIATGCSAGNYASNDGTSWDYQIDGDFKSDGDNYRYNSIEEKPFYNTSETKESYFSLDRNTATYSLVRNQINNWRKVQEDSVRIEEMINYFDYGYPAPADSNVGVSTYVTDCPWNEENKLMVVGVKTAEMKLETTKNNYVFLIDVSGSMSGSDRLGLVKYGVNKLVDSFTENDRVAIVTYASGVKTVRESTICTAENKLKIKNAVNGLVASGATNGGDGLKRAYNIAKQGVGDGVNSRIIMMSDGDFNVGIRNQTTLKETIQDYAKSGVYLSVLGFGMGNTRDDFLETLAVNGNGNYAYIDCEVEAEKVLVNELSGTLKTVAKDAKAGVEFNTEKVEKYRLIGYDTKYISQEDFNNSEVDAGEIGSNLCVTAMYEVTLKGGVSDSEKLATVTVKYKDVSDNESEKQVEKEILFEISNDNNVKFAAAVAYFGLLLRNSSYKANATFNGLAEYLGSLTDYAESDIYKKEFITLVGTASEIYQND